MHKLERAQHQMRRELRQLQAHHLENRLASVEQQQTRLASFNFNLSREVASLDKMHSSVLELLEDVEEVEAKVDTVMPDVRHEISKLEFNVAQLNSEQGLVREEGRNRGKSLQAIAVSVSALQAERKAEQKVAIHEMGLHGVAATERPQRKWSPDPIDQVTLISLCIYSRSVEGNTGNIFTASVVGVD